jgi:hypothetical protein
MAIRWQSNCSDEQFDGGETSAARTIILEWFLSPIRLTREPRRGPDPTNFVERWQLSLPIVLGADGNYGIGVARKKGGTILMESGGSGTRSYVAQFGGFGQFELGGGSGSYDVQIATTEARRRDLMGRPHWSVTEIALRSRTTHTVRLTHGPVCQCAR